MGWIVWFLETLLCAGASYAVGAALFPERLLQRWIAALLVAPSLILGVIYLLGLPGWLRPWPLGLLAAVVFAAAGAVALRRLGWPRLRELFRYDLRAPVRLWREAVADREPAVVLVLAGALVMLTAGVFVVIYRSWTWDPMWYHVPITSYTIQYGSLQWIDTPVPWTQSHPRNVELLAVWNCIFPHDNTLDDSSQLPFGILGALVIAAWARRWGARAPFAAGLGATYLLLPPIYLQIWSTHVDVACGSAFGAAVFFLSGEVSARNRWMALLAFGLYVGTKMTGAVHLAMALPWIAVRIALELRRGEAGRRLRLLGDVALSGLALAAVGSFKYFQNLLVTGNPVYAWKAKVPLLGWELPGKFDPASFYDTAAGQNPLFFGANGTFQRLLRSWYYDPPTFWPDVRTGGFGVVFAYLAIPALLLTVADLFRKGGWKRVLPVWALFWSAIMVPAPWWPRFVVGAAIAGLVAIGAVQAQTRWHFARVVLGVALVALAAATFYKGAKAQFDQAELFMYPQQFSAAWKRSPEQRATLQVVNWLWPEEWSLAKEREFHKGDVLVYDESVNFLGDLFTHDYRSRVEFVSSADPNAFISAVERMNARWVGVTRGSQAERMLQERGAQFLFMAPVSRMAMYRVRE